MNTPEKGSSQSRLETSERSPAPASTSQKFNPPTDHKPAARRITLWVVFGVSLYLASAGGFLGGCYFGRLTAPVKGVATGPTSQTPTLPSATAKTAANPSSDAAQTGSGISFDSILATVDADERLVLLEAFARKAVAKDPPVALSAAMQLTDATRRAELVEELVRAWGATDPAATFSWLAARPAEAVPPEAVAAAAELLSHADFAAAGARIAALPPGSPLRDAAAPAYARALAAQSPIMALDWARTLPEGTGRDAAAASAFAVWAAKDPAAAANAALTTSANDAERNRHAGIAAGLWATADPDGASAWASQLPSSPVRDTALGHTVAAMAERQPARALSFAGRIEEPRARAGAYENAFSGWPLEDAVSRDTALRQLLASEADARVRRTLTRLASELDVSVTP